MDIFVLPVELERGMLDHARAEPLEVGGLLVGSASCGGSPTRLVRRVNVHPQPETHCSFDDADAGLASDEAIHAVYHSHPISPTATPSPYDAIHAEDLDLVYVIVAPRAQDSTLVRAWRFEPAPGVGRRVVEVPIRRTCVEDDIETVRGYLTPGSVVSLIYRRNDGHVRWLDRARVDRLGDETVVVLVNRRQVRINLSRIRSVQVLIEASVAISRRTFSAALLREGADQLELARVGDARSAIEAAFRAMPGLRPRMGDR